MEPETLNVMKSILESLNWRYATKQFDEQKKLSQEQLETLHEVLRLTPSSFGLQPWKFVLVASPEKRAALLAHSWGQQQVVQASHLYVLCRPEKITESMVDHYISHTASEKGISSESLEPFSKVIKQFLDRMSEEQKGAWMKNQVYLALSNLLTACATLRIDACPMEGFIPEQYSEVLGLSSMGLFPEVVCPVGFRSAGDKYAQAPKVRYPLDQVIVEI